MTPTIVKKKKLLPNNLAVKLPEYTKPQKEVHDDNTRFKVIDAGRRFGKSMYAKLEGLDRAINYSQKVWFVSPTYGNVMTHWREVKRLIGDLYTYKNEQQKYIEFEREDGRLGSIAFKSSDRPDNLRGEGLDFIIMDEAAFQDADTWDSILSPMLADRQGGALFISTPNGTQNWFYAAYNNGRDPLKEDWKSWRFKTIDNPYIKQSEIDRARRDMPELKFKQEYLAEFVSDAGGVFHNVEDRAINYQLSEPEYGKIYYAGIDWGRKNDFTVVSIFDNTGAQVRIERFTDIGWAYQSQKIIALHEKWNFQKILVETNAAGAVVAEGLQAAGLPITAVYMTNVLKVSLVERLAANIERGIISLIKDGEPNGAIQIGELLSYSIERTKNGIGVTYNAPKGGHDDTVVATMIVNQLFYKHTTNKIKKAHNPFYGGKKKERHIEDAYEGWYKPNDKGFSQAAKDEWLADREKYGD
jgi:phage FluMu gp28-like protein